jgi:hypothetical protein
MIAPYLRREILNARRMQNPAFFAHPAFQMLPLRFNLHGIIAAGRSGERGTRFVIGLLLNWWGVQSLGEN